MPISSRKSGKNLPEKVVGVSEDLGGDPSALLVAGFAPPPDSHTAWAVRAAYKFASSWNFPMFFL